MPLDAFERYKHNRYLSPITTAALEDLGRRCGLSAEADVLDIECGKGGAALALARAFGCVVTGLDPRPEFAEEARRRALFEDLGHLVHIVDGGPGEVPFDDAFFDLALMLGRFGPYEADRAAGELVRVVRPGGRIAAAGLAWRPGGREAAGEALRAWLGRLSPSGIREIEAIREGHRAAGLEVEGADAWEGFYAPQARSILENRRELRDSPEDQATLDRWQEDLEVYHSGGGREALAYVRFLLRRP